jgi:threonine/homoserine/homoserine lactone efflux protein
VTPDLLLAFAAYAFVTSITPGPNNTMLLASGVTFGFGPSVPHILGISIGFAVMVLAVGLGVGALFTAVPLLYDLLRVVGALYLAYLAWRIARSGPVEGEGTAGKPLSFWQAAAFQWVNPKAWVMAMGAVTAYTPQQGYFANVVIVALVFMLVNAPCVSAWAGTGVALRRILSDPRWVRVFNVGMALLLVASLYPILRDLGVR